MRAICRRAFFGVIGSVGRAMDFAIDAKRVFGAGEAVIQPRLIHG